MSKYLEYFDGAFDSTVADKRKLENKPYVAYSRTEGVVYTIIPKEDGTMYTIYKVVHKDISNCTYNMVDLGLPSGLKWADRNVGATSPEDYGSYFQWGDTIAYTLDREYEITTSELASLLQSIIGDEMEVTKDNVGDVLLMLFDGYDVGTDLTNTPFGPLVVSEKEFNWDNYKFGTYSNLTKYNSTDNLTMLETVDDAATVNMGNTWRMPTVDEIKELTNNTTLTFIDIDGIEYSLEQAENGAIEQIIEQRKLKGARITGSNGNSIFIPAAGCHKEFESTDIGMNGVLWSSNLTDYSSYIRAEHFNLLSGNTNALERHCGLSVRGVQA